MMNEAIIKRKEDLEKIGERTQSLLVKTPIEQKDAIKILSRCRMLEEVIFTPQAFFNTEDDTKKYLSRFVFVETEGRAV